MPRMGSFTIISLLRTARCLQPMAERVPSASLPCCKDPFLFWEGNKTNKAHFLPFVQSSPLKKRGLLARKAPGSKEPLKSLLIMSEIGQPCSLGNIMRPKSRKKLRELVPTDSQLQAKQVWPALIKVINILKPVIKQEAVKGSLPFTSGSC